MTPTTTPQTAEPVVLMPQTPQLQEAVSVSTKAAKAKVKPKTVKPKVKLKAKVLTKTQVKPKVKTTKAPTNPRGRPKLVLTKNQVHSKNPCPKCHGHVWDTFAKTKTGLIPFEPGVGSAIVDLSAKDKKYIISNRKRPVLADVDRCVKCKKMVSI